MVKNGTKTYFKNFSELEKEEEWINKKCSEGWKLINIIMGFAFTFEKCEKDEFIIRCYCFDDKENKRQDIISTILDQGGEIIPHLLNTISQIVYFIRKSNLGEFEIDTDLDSKILQYRKRGKVYKNLANTFILLGIIILIVFNADNSFLMQICGITELICGSLLYLPVFKYNKLIKRLEEERNIHE